MMAPPDSLSDHVHSLKSDAGSVVLEELRSALDGKRVIGLGEATHGTKEFFELKNRLVRYLVSEQDVRLIGLEASFPAALAVNDYVTTGVGDPADVLADLHFWTWNTESMRALLEWLRSYNDGRPASDVVQFHGFDMQFTTGAARRLSTFLERVDPAFHETVESDLETLCSKPLGHRPDPPSDVLDLARTVTATLEDRFSEHGADYRARTTDRNWRLSQQYRRTLEQATALAAARLGETAAPVDALRDAFMAENVAWLREHTGQDRAIVWAHNGHVKRGFLKGAEWESNAQTMGSHIADTHGSSYYALGFELGRGTFRAYPDSGGGLQTFSTEIESESIAAALADISQSPLFLDLESPDDAVRDWLTDEQLIHNIGSMYDPEARSYMHVEPAVEFDGLAFVAETTASVPVEATDEST